MRNRWMLSAIVALAPFANTHATVFTWPGAAPCDTTLNACANNSAIQQNDTIILAPTGTIDETVTVYSGVSFTAAPGFSPVFSAGHSLSINGGGSGSSVTVQGLTFVDGHLDVTFIDQIIAKRLNVNFSSVSGGNFGIRLYGVSNFEVAENKIVVNGIDGASAIGIESEGVPAVSGNVHDNRLFANVNVASIFFQGNASIVRVYANNIYNGNLGAFSTAAFTGGRLEFVDNAVHCSGNQDSTYVVSGISVSSENSAHADVVNNTAVGCEYGIDLGGPLDGLLANNIVANNTFGVNVHNTDTFGMTSASNLLWGNGSNLMFTPDASTIIEDPQFVRGNDDIRLSAGSPAIDAGDTAALNQVLSARSIPAIDADGSRRFKGGGGKVDIGAFEYGDASFFQTAMSGETTLPKSIVAPDDMPQEVQNYTPDTYIARGFEDGLTGFQTADGRRDLVAEDTGSSPVVGSMFNVFAPAKGDGRFTVTTSVASVNEFTAEIDNAYTDDHPERIVMTTLDSKNLFDHPYAAVYSDKRWRIVQLDGHTGDPDFPSGVSFNLYAQDPSINAFTYTVPLTSSTLTLDHPLLNGEPCAHVFVGNAASHPYPISLEYFYDQWHVLDTSGGAFIASTQLPVVIDEAGTQACRYDHIFHHDFELVVD